MSRRQTCLVLFGWLALTAGERSAADEPVARPQRQLTRPTNPELREELLRRRTTDQSARTTIMEALDRRGLEWNETALSHRAIKPLVEKMQQVDAENRRWLETVVDKQGWPLISQVGKSGAQGAFMIAQHATADRAFQKKCLALMQAAPKGEVALPDVALLTDRVLLADGKKQKYGSQVERRNGKWVPRPTTEPDRLDVRRAEMGLPPMEQYLKLLDAAYGSLKPDSPIGTSPAPNCRRRGVKSNDNLQHK